MLSKVGTGYISVSSITHLGHFDGKNKGKHELIYDNIYFMSGVLH